MMNRSFFRALALTLCLTLLCAVAAGCRPQTPATDPSTASTTDPTTASTRPTAAPLENASDSIFIGTWNVSAQNSDMTSITFREDGSLTIVLNGGRLGGAFYVKSDSDLTLVVSNSELAATYTVDGDTITVTTENDVWTLSKP